MHRMKSATVAIVALTVMFLHSGAACAADPILLFGTHFGGDELAEVEDIYGDSRELRAGQLFSFTAGIVQPVAESVELQASIGWKFDFVSADDGDLSFDRFPLDVLAFYRPNKNLRFGAGLTYHLRPTFRGDGLLSDLDADFDDALGYVLEGGYEFHFGLYVAGKLTFIDYEESTAGVSVNGNSIGALVGYRFR